MLIRAGSLAGAASNSLEALLRWQSAIFFFLCVSIGFLGIGRIELPGLRLSSWSIARTVFFFWLSWKILQGLRYGWAGLELGRISLPFSLFALFGFVTLSLFPYFQEAGDYRYFVFAFFHSVVVADLFRGETRARFLLFLLGAVPAFLVVRGIAADPSVLDLSRMVRFGYPLDHPNTAGYLFSMSIPLSLGILARERGWMRWAGGLSLAAQFAGLVLTYSRAAWLGCGIALLGLALMEQRLRKGVLALAVLGLLVVAFAAPVRGRVVSFVDGLLHPDMTWRYRIMAASISLGIENPLLGIGYGRERLRAAVADKQPEFFGERYIHHSHNVYTEVLSGTGFLGLGAFLWLLGSTLARLWRAEQYRSYLAASLLAFMFSGLGDVPFYHHETRIFFFTLLALCWLAPDPTRTGVLTSS